jgi:thymidine phosphorylase
MIRAQGGDPEAPPARGAHRHVVMAEEDGYLVELDAYAVGVAAWRLGAGRARKEDPVQAGAGVICLAKPGERVAAGQPLLELYTDTPEALPAALEALGGGWSVGGDAPSSRSPLVIDTIRP